MKLLLLLPLFTFVLTEDPAAPGYKYGPADFCAGNSLDLPMKNDSDYENKLNTLKDTIKVRLAEFKNCKVVLGNLIIAFEFNSENYKNIEEITGYLKFYDIPNGPADGNPITTVVTGGGNAQSAAGYPRITMNSLKLIHGDTLDKYKGALVFNKVYSDFASFDQLHMIKKGKIVFTDSPKLCYWEPSHPADKDGVIYTQFVDWDETDPFNDKFAVKDTDFPESFSYCKDEDLKCGNGYVTGCMTKDNSQNPDLKPKVDTSNKDCPSECEKGRCYKNDAGEQTCHTCSQKNRYFNKDLKCVDTCLQDGDFAYGQYCINNGAATCKQGFKEEQVNVGEPDEQRFVATCSPTGTTPS